MSFRSTSEAAATAVFEYLSITPSGEQTKNVIAIIEQAVINTAVEANQRCAQTAQSCCSADRDLAHKIAVEIKKGHMALITNLSAMR
jgi:hypothetical protein